MNKWLYIGYIIFLFFLPQVTACTTSNSASETSSASQMESDNNVETSESLPTSTPVPETNTPTSIPPSLTPTLSEPTATLEPTATATPEFVEQTVLIPNNGDVSVYMDPGSESSNTGDRDMLTFGGDSDANNFYILIKFNTSYFIPENAVVKRAHLKLITDTDLYWGFPFTIYPVEEAWGERTVTSATLPRYNQELALEYAMDEINTTMSYSIIDIVQGWVDGQIEEHGLLLTTEAFQTIVTFHARDGNYQLSPHLEVTFDGPLPEVIPTNEPIEETKESRWLPDFANPEEMVLSALYAWEANDVEQFTLHFYLGQRDAPPAFEALNNCDFPVDAISFLTTPATDIGRQMTNVDAYFYGELIGSFLVIDANRYRIAEATLVCAN